MTPAMTTTPHHTPHHTPRPHSSSQFRTKTGTKASIKIRIKTGIKRATALGLTLLLCSTLASTAHASSQLALEKGCMNCHGTSAATARKHTPSFEHLAAEQASRQGQPGADQKLADELREHKFFGNVTAHETLTPEAALALSRWIMGGAK
jgi:cytochrome c551/c552